MKPILPGSTIGVLGSGQLGRMFAIAARRLGYRVHTLAPEHDTPTGHIADLEVVASYDDLDQLRAFAAGVDVVTFEFENVPAAAAAAAMSQLYSRNGTAPGMIPPPHFWSQFYGLNHQLGLLSGLAGNLTPVGPESAGSAGSPPSPSSISPAGTFQSHQRYSPYPIPGGKSQLRTPSPRNPCVAPPSPK